MDDRPLDIRRFETLQIASVVVAIINGFSVGQEGVVGPVFDAVFVTTFSLLISRGRKNWARWTLLGCFVAGVIFLVVASFFGLTQEALSHAHLSTGNLVLAALVWLMQVWALTLVFTPQSADWLRSAHADI
jgi:uncharacterized BrkB/YihY/UPF0761 family membrane protein